MCLHELPQLKPKPLLHNELGFWEPPNPEPQNTEFPVPKTRITFPTCPMITSFHHDVVVKKTRLAQHEKLFRQISD